MQHLGEFDFARLDCSGASTLADASNHNDVIGAKLTNVEFEYDRVILRFDDLSGYRSGYGALSFNATGIVRIHVMGKIGECSAAKLHSMVGRTVYGCCLSSRDIMLALEDNLGHRDTIVFKWGPAV